MYELFHGIAVGITVVFSAGCIGLAVLLFQEPAGCQITKKIKN